MAEPALSPVARAERLRISEVFYSLQGESLPVGLPTVFVRLTGCPLRCSYCDTEYAFHGGQVLAMDELLAQIGTFSTRRVCVTGGEPLAQRNCLVLMKNLCDAGYEVSLETSGALDISAVDSRVTIVMDIKTPASGESERNRWANLDVLKADDQIKFVIADAADYAWSVARLKELDLEQRFAVLFSPAWGQLNATDLADWILRDALEVRFQMQLHKLLWGEEPGH